MRQFASTARDWEEIAQELQNEIVRLRSDRIRILRQYVTARDIAADEIARCIWEEVFVDRWEQANEVERLCYLNAAEALLKLLEPGAEPAAREGE